MTHQIHAPGRLPSPRAARSACLLAFGPLVLGALAFCGPALADGRLDAKYVLSIAGVELGRATVVAEATDTTYELAGTGRITGVLRALSSGRGSVASKGAIGLGKTTPRLFAVAADADGKPESVRFAISGNAVKDLAVEPPPKPLPDRVEVTEAHLLNVMDPLSGAFVYVPGTTDMLSAAACDRTVPVFDGRQRFDISLSYLRTEPVKIEKGFSGRAVVCRAAYAPVAGHRPNRPTVKYMQANKEMYVWLVPIEGTRLMAPFKVSVATMIGTALFEATSFESKAKDATVSVSAPKP